jgi:hypothetical protein
MDFLTHQLQSLANWAEPKKKSVYHLSEGSESVKSEISVKGSLLCSAQLAAAGFHKFDVPPAFILSSQLATEYFRSRVSSIENISSLGSHINEAQRYDIEKAIIELERATQCEFGAHSGREAPPLLLSVKAGSPIASISVTNNSCVDADISNTAAELFDLYGAHESWCIPGIKESSLAIGLNDSVVEHLAKSVGIEFALNLYSQVLNTSN